MDLIMASCCSAVTCGRTMIAASSYSCSHTHNTKHAPQLRYHGVNEHSSVGCKSVGLRVRHSLRPQSAAARAHCEQPCRKCMYTTRANSGCCRQGSSCEEMDSGVPAPPPHAQHSCREQRPDIVCRGRSAASVIACGATAQSGLTG